MTVAPGRYRLGPDNGQLVIRTFREGLGARAGHDLVIDVTRWSGELTVNDDKSPAAIEAKIDMNSWIVREGNGGIKPLTDRDRREITTTARRVLSVQQHPDAEFTATGFMPAGDGGGRSTGPLRWRGSPGRCACRSARWGRVITGRRGRSSSRLTASSPTPVFLGR